MDNSNVVKIAEWLEYYWLVFARSLIALSLILIPAGYVPWVNGFLGYLIIGLGVVYIVVEVQTVRATNYKDAKLLELKEPAEKLKDSQRQLDEAQEVIDYLKKECDNIVYDSVSEYLAHIANDHVNFEDSERISLYLYVDKKSSDGRRSNVDRKFVLAGRYSKNKEFSEMNRQSFPIAEGCIGQAWSNGGKFFKELPLDERKYYSYLKKSLSISVGKAKCLRMKSRAYCCFALKDNSHRVGVLVFESLNHNALIESRLKGCMITHEGFLRERLRLMRRSIELNSSSSMEDGNV